VDWREPVVTHRLDNAAPEVSPAGWQSLREAALLNALVGLGAAIGGGLRALASLGALQIMGTGFPWGTLLVNALGSFAIGFYATLTEPGGRVAASDRQKQFVMTGVCGGFTTFSVFSLETLRLAQMDNWSAAAVNVAVSVTVWIVAVWLGHRIALLIDG
jgi:fluoride exporter